MYISSRIYPFEVETQNVAVYRLLWHSSFKTQLTFYMACKINDNKMVVHTALIYTWGNAQKVITITR